MGGKESSGFLATGSGENELMRCENGDYFADIEAARGVPRAPELPERLDAARDRRRGDDDRGTGGAPRHRRGGDVEGMPVVTGDRLVLALVRGDDRLSEEKLETLFEASFRPATDEEIRAAFNAGGGLGPVGADFEVIADEALREGQFVAGANRDGWHLRGVEAGRDFEPTFADIRQAREGDACPVCGGRLVVQPAIEVGHIFKLGTFHSQALGARFLDEDGQEKPIIMGSYGIGPARTIAAIVEQHHDERGIVWPRPSRRTTRISSSCPAWKSAGRGRRRALGRRPGRAAGRPRPASRRKVRRRRPHRHSDAHHGRQEDTGRWRRGRPRQELVVRSGAYLSPKLETR